MGHSGRFNEVWLTVNLDESLFVFFLLILSNFLHVFVMRRDFVLIFQRERPLYRVVSTPNSNQVDRDVCYVAPPSRSVNLRRE